MLTFFCRLAADFSLYFSFANCVLLFASPENSAAFFWPIAALLADGLIAYGFKTKFKWKTITTAPLLLPVAILFVTPGWLPLIIFLPPWIYLIYIIYMDQEQLTYSDYHDRFFLGLKLLPLMIPVLIFSLNSRVFSLFQIRILPFVIFFLFSSILSLRLSRYQPDTLKQRTARLANLLFLAVFILVSLTVVYSNVWTLIRDIASFLYRFVIAPIILLVALVISLPFFAINMLLKLFASEPSPDDEIFMIELGELVDSSLESYRTLQIPAFVKYIFYFLLLAGVLYLVWRFFRKLAARGSVKTQVEAVMENRQKLEPRSGREIDLFPPSDPRKAIRYYYRRFLRQCRKRGLLAGPNHTSRDVGAAAAVSILGKVKAPASGDVSLSESVSFEDGILREALISLDKLRELYLPARYDESGHTLFYTDDAASAKDYSSQIIKALSRKDKA